MNKTIYVKDADGPIWDKARELAGDGISQLVVEKLRAFVGEQEGKQRGFERIVLSYVEQGIPRAQAFVGRWLISPDERWATLPPTPDGLDYYAVAVTSKDNVVVFNFGAPPKNGEFGAAILTWDDSFYRANRRHPGGAIEAAIRRKGIEVQELDI